MIEFMRRGSGTSNTLMEFCCLLRLDSLRVSVWGCVMGVWGFRRTLWETELSSERYGIFREILDRIFLDNSYL